MNNGFGFFIGFIYYKLILFIEKITGRKERFYPKFMKGVLKINPDFLKRIGKPKKIICVMGTNGKTSVCNLLIDSLRNCGYSVINNNEWSLILGISHMFAKKVNIFNKSKYDYAVVETDELSSPKIYKYLKPDYVVVTNLFRDSLKKNGNSEYMLNILKSSIPNVKLVLNADDIISSELKNDKTVFYGIDEIDNDKDYCDNIVNDMPTCPNCHSKLYYTNNRYNHIGKCYCNNCGFKNSNTDYSLSNIKNNECIINNYKYPLVSDSIFNIYNELAAVALLEEIKIKREDIYKSMKKIKITDSRFDVRYVSNIKFVSILSKGQNPVACSSVFNYVRSDNSKKDILMMLDDMEDNKNGSETISWLFETDFEFLNSKSLNRIVVAGKRRYDMLVRLELAGIDKNKITIIEHEKDLVNYVNRNIESLYFLYDINLKEMAKPMKDIIEKKLGE